MHYPVRTTESHGLPPRFQALGGKIPNITEEQFKMIQEQMNKSTYKDFPQ